jgi:methyl-accepting chemotaxis protein
MRIRLGISAKFVGLVALSFVGVIAVATLTLSTLRDNLLSDRKAKTREIVEVAYSLVDYYGQSAQTGALTEAQAKQEAARALEKLRYSGDGYVWINDMQPRLVMHPMRKDLMDKDLAAFTDARGSHVYSDIVRIAQAGGGFDSFWFSKPGAPLTEFFPKIAYVKAYAPWGWVICTGIYVDDVDRIFWSEVRSVGLTITGLIVVIGLLSTLLARSVVRPIHAIVGMMGRLAGGDTSVTVPGLARHDEIGAMAAAVLVFKDNAAAVKHLQTEQEQERQHAETEKRTALTHMADTIETETGVALEHIRRRTTAMMGTADAMNASAERTGAAAGTAAGAAGQAMANAQSVAGAAEQLSTSIREIGSQMSQSAAVVGRAVIAGSETRATIEALNQEVEQIGAVADMIGAIAAKTNLLALNATIEAARAGDAGKGFAVVASEVKALATQTARSTQEITRHIHQVRTATGASVAAVVRIEQTIAEVNAIAGSIAAAVEQQGAATAEIARNVTKTATAANEMTTRTAEVSAEASETGRHATEVRENATGLSNAVEELRHSVIRVLRTSTTEVDRRRSPRQTVDIPCRLTITGQNHNARVVDLSSIGAQVRDAPASQAGLPGTLDVDGVDYPLPFIVKRNVDGVLGVEFTLDKATATKFQETVERLGQRRAA